MAKTLNQLVKYLTCRKINLVRGLVMQAQRTVMRKRMKLMGSQTIQNLKIPRQKTLVELRNQGVFEQENRRI